MDVGSLVSRARGGVVPPAAEVPRWLWLWFAPAVVGVQIAVLAWDRDLYDRYIESESGLVENGTAAVLLAAIFFGASALRHRAVMANRLLTLWLAAVTLGCVYFAGEEVSWGQHWFGWETPEAIARINDQGETSLHNMSSWLDQKPRGLLLLWVVVGGFLYPIWTRVRSPRKTPASAWQAWFWPRYVCLPAAALAVLVRLPEYGRQWFEATILSWLAFRASEPQELAFALFLLIYLCSLYFRLRAPGRQKGGARTFNSENMY